MPLIIPGNIIPKKNSRRLFRVGKGKRLMSLPSKEYRAWSRDAGLAVNRWWAGASPFAGDIEVTALIYRTRAGADLDNLLASVGDLLQQCKVIVNDRQIKSWDGSRQFIDKARPRVEVTVRELVE